MALGFGRGYTGGYNLQLRLLSGYGYGVAVIFRIYIRGYGYCYGYGWGYSIVTVADTVGLGFSSHGLRLGSNIYIFLFFFGRQLGDIRVPLLVCFSFSPGYSSTPE